MIFTNRNTSGRELTVAFLNKVVEGVSITGVSEFIVVWWKLLKTLHCNGAEVARKGSVLGQHR